MQSHLKTLSGAEIVEFRSLPDFFKSVPTRKTYCTTIPNFCGNVSPNLFFVYDSDPKFLWIVVDPKCLDSPRWQTFVQIVLRSMIENGREANTAYDTSTARIQTSSALPLFFAYLVGEDIHYVDIALTKPIFLSMESGAEFSYNRPPEGPPSYPPPSYSRATNEQYPMGGRKSKRRKQKKSCRRANKTKKMKQKKRLRLKM